MTSSGFKGFPQQRAPKNQFKKYLDDTRYIEPIEIDFDVIIEIPEE